MNLSPAESLLADSLAKELTSRYVAVPDSIVRNGRELRVHFLHAPFAGWTEPNCRGSYGGSREFANPVAHALWKTLGGHGVTQITLVARSEGRTIRWLSGGRSCGAGEEKFYFYPRDFHGAHLIRPAPRPPGSARCSESADVEQAIAAQVTRGDGAVLDMRIAAPFDWSRLYVFPPYTKPEQITRALGFAWPWSSRPLTGELAWMIVRIK